MEGSASWDAAGLENRSPVKAGGFDSCAFRALEVLGKEQLHARE